MLNHDTKAGSIQITEMLQRLEGGSRDALNEVVPLVYDELRKLAKSHLRRETNAGPPASHGAGA